uniref:Uncharacterized protein n=1 Tax=Arundo donax TaxID=35708 RepID=A0A0A8XSI4_ARUDO
MCDRFLTFLAKNLSMNRHKAITEGPRNGGGGGGGRQLEGGEEDEDDDEFAIRIERAEFDFELGGHGDDGPTGVTTVLEDVSTAAATASDEQRQKGAAAAADRPVAVAETKVRKTMTIKEDRPEEVAGGGNKGAAVLEKKKSMFKRRQASSSLGAGGEEQGGRAPRRSGLRPRMPAVLRVPSNIDERSSTFIKERRKIFGGAGNPAPADK